MTRMERRRLEQITGQRDAMVEAVVKVAQDFENILEIMPRGMTNYDDGDPCEVVLLPIKTLKDFINVSNNLVRAAASFEARGQDNTPPPGDGASSLS